MHRGPEDLQHCSFCGKSQKQVKTLIAGPHVFICETCVSIAAAVAGVSDADVPAGSAIEPVGEEARTERCGFCGKRRHQVSGMASAGSALPPAAAKAANGSPRICAECLSLCHEILDEQLA